MPLGSGLELIVHVVGDATKLGTALDGANQKIAGFGSSIKDTNTRIGAVVEIGKKAAKVTVDLGKAGKDAAVAEAAFAESLADLGAAQEGWQAKTDSAILAAQKLGQTDDAARAAITTLVTATGDLDQALSLLPGVMDIAAGSGKTFEQSADAVAKALTGQDRMLRAMLPGMGETASAAETIGLAMENTSGQAELWAKTTEGTAARANIAMSEAGESIGGVFVQAFQGIKEALDPLMESLRPFLEAVRELLTAIMPFLNPLLEAMGTMLGRVADKLSRIVNLATRVLQFFTDLLGKLQEVADKIAGLMPDFDKLKNFDITPGDRLPFSNSASAAGGASAGTYGGAGTARSVGAPIINIYGDPAVIEAKVASAIRNYNRRNGVGSIFQPGRS